MSVDRMGKTDQVVAVHQESVQYKRPKTVKMDYAVIHTPEAAKSVDKGHLSTVLSHGRYAEYIQKVTVIWRSR